MLWSLALVALLASASALNLPGVPTAFTQDDAVLSAISDDIANKFADEYMKFMKTGVESATLRQISKQLAGSQLKKNYFTEDIVDLGAIDQFAMCTTCRATLNVVTRMFLDPEGELNGPNKEANSKKTMLEICDRFNIETQEVCDGLFEMNWNYIDHIMQNSVADTRSLCGTLPITFCKVKQNEYNWSVKVDGSGAAITGPKKDIPKASDADLKILQITDIHFDPEYAEGALADCPEPLCCRIPAGEGVESPRLAGYWSDYRSCDTPLYMIDDAFDSMKKSHAKIDYIYQTGDIIPHTVWDTTKEGNIEMITKINDLIKLKFGDIPVYSTVGNHEAHPTNVFSGVDSPDTLNVKWLYEHLYNTWSKWLPADTKETILKGGYYTVSPKKGFRVIALNNMECYIFNWWIYLDGSFAIEQLQWLHDTLLAAEKAGEYVHILAHIPVGSADCWSVWAREYNRIIERFSPIIGGMFNGHTHKDEMNVHYSANKHAVAVSWNGGSLTSYTYKNPNYRMYHVEPESMQVVDHETWIFDVNAANAKGNAVSPVWYKEYQFSQEFTGDLSPAGIDALLDNMAKNPELVRKYWRYKMTSAQPKMDAGCNEKCLLSTICGLATANYDDKERCKELKEELKANLDTDESTTESTTGGTTGGTTENPDDGAASISALKITTIVGLFALVKFFF